MVCCKPKFWKCVANSEADPLICFWGVAVWLPLCFVAATPWLKTDWYLFLLDFGTLDLRLAPFCIDWFVSCPPHSKMLSSHFAVKPSKISDLHSYLICVLIERWVGTDRLWEVRVQTLPELNLTVICPVQNFLRKDFSGLECGLSKDLKIFV